MKKAFTLIELLIAISILGIIASFIIVQMIGAANAAKDAKRKADVDIIKNALIQYRSENYTKGSIQPATCEIGTNCTNFDSDIQAFLESLPKDPNGTSYTYRSADGTDCSITAILSDGSAYTYDCQTEVATFGDSTNGVCGITSASSLTSSTPGLCTQGVPVLFAGSGPWTWTCSGTDGGSNDTCLAFVQMVCSTSSSDCTGDAVEVLRMSDIAGGHAELPGQTNYTQKVCCTGPEIGNSCSATKNAIILKLYSATNAHVEQNNLSNYASNACLSTGDTFDAACSYASDCSSVGPEYQCLGSISDTTNAHAGGCSDAFATKVCCNIY